MIEKLVNSKTRLEILKLFLSHIDDRYYLRELERMLNESLSPLRRQLVKLVEMGILIVEEEANLKYYRLNKDFEGLEELKNMILERNVIARSPEGATKQSIEIPRFARNDPSGQIASLTSFARNDNYPAVSAPRQVRYDIALLSFISIFVLMTAIFVGYISIKNTKQVARLMSNTEIASAPAAPRNDNYHERNTISASNGEMMSKKWKVMPGNIPVLSSGETGEDKKSKEL